MDLRTELIEFLRVNNWMSLENEANATGVVDVYLKTYKIDLSDNELLIHDVIGSVCKDCESTDTKIVSELEYDDGSDEPNTSNNLITVKYLYCNNCGEQHFL